MESKTGDITPNNAAFAQLQDRFTRSIAWYRQDLRLLERMRDLLPGNWLDPLSDRVRMKTLLEEMIAAKTEKIEESIEAIQQGSAELERMSL